MADSAFNIGDDVSSIKTCLTPEDRSRLAHIAMDSKERIAREAITQVAEAVGVSFAMICGPRRKPYICAARDLAAYIAFREGASYAAISRVMDRDHTTIISAVRRERKRRGEL